MIQLARKVRGVVDTARSYLSRQWFEQYTSVLVLTVEDSATSVEAQVKLFDDEGQEILALQETLKQGGDKWSSVVTIQSQEKPGSLLVIYKITDEQGEVSERMSTFTKGDELTVFTVKELQMGSTILCQKYRNVKGSFGVIRLKRPAANKSFGEQKHGWYGWTSR